MALPAAGGPAIFRAAQKDEYFTKHLGGSASEVLRLLFGNKAWHRYSRYVPFASHLVYNSVTTLRDLQTLGEEYTGIVQVDDSYVNIPAKLLQVLSILLGAFGHNLVKKILGKAKESVTKNERLLPYPKTLFLKIISLALWALPIAQELHQACFFLGATHYSIPKRLMCINYVSAIPGRSPQISTLRPLGVPYLTRAILNAIRSPPTFADVQIDKKPNVPHSIQSSCIACAEVNRSPCSLPCGHILCNTCARSSSTCPMCRASYVNHRAVPLQNFVLTS